MAFGTSRGWAGIAVALAAAALAGCAGVRRPEPPASFFAEDDGAPRAAAPPAPEPPPPPARADATGEVARVRAHVSAHMPAQAPEVRTRLARTIVSESRRARLDPLLVLAVIHVESSFDPRAVSSAGAVGLMQLREPTMRGEARLSRLGSTNRRDPVANVRAGVRYLRRLLDAFGELDLALMAYNAGPGKLRERLARPPLPDRYREYAVKVNVELARLRALYGRRAGGLLAAEGAESGGPRALPPGA